MPKGDPEPVGRLFIYIITTIMATAVAIDPKSIIKNKGFFTNGSDNIIPPGIIMLDFI